jgi:acyl-CoA reductase-like NAD-dependent aldehyde dehydrogenase
MFKVDNQHVQDAVSKGAKILVGGKRGERTAYYPTILTDVTQECVRFVTFTPNSYPDEIVDRY